MLVVFQAVGTVNAKALSPECAWSAQETIPIPEILIQEAWGTGRRDILATC